MKEKSKVGYVRTSLREEKIENQKKAIRDKYGDIKIFEDLGVSGIIPTNHRKGFLQMLQYIENHRDVNSIVVFELSRIGRSFIETLNLVTELEKKGIKVISVSPQESWTTMENNEIRQLITMIFSWTADMERKNLIERTKQGIERARTEGKHIGRPERKINWREFDKWRKKGLSVSAISRVMDIPYPTLIVKVKEREETKL